MKDPCKKYVKDASKKTSVFSRDYWSGALLFIQAAECYKSSGDFENAFKYAMKAANALKKYASKYGYELVIRDIEKALLIAYNVAKENKKEEVKRELFNMMNLRAKHMEMSGNYLGAADAYRRSIEFAPSGQEALNTLTHAAQLLERVIEQKSRMGKDQLVDKLLSKLEEIKSLIPTVEASISAKPLETISIEANSKAVFEYVDIPSKVKERIITSIQSLPIADVSATETARGHEINFKFTGEEIIGKISLIRGRIILDMTGKEPILVYRYFNDLKNMIMNSADDCKIIDQKLRGFSSLDVLLGILNDALDKTTSKATYREIALDVKSAVDILTNIGDEKKFKSALKRLESLKNFLQKAIYEDSPILDEDSDKISKLLEECIREVRKHL